MRRVDTAPKPGVERGRDKKDSEPKKRDWRWMLAAGGALLITVGGIIDRAMPDKSADKGDEAGQGVDPKDLEQAQRQLGLVSDMLAAAAKDPKIANPEAPKRIKKTHAFTEMGITKEILTTFPDAKKESTDFMDMNSDREYSEELAANAQLREQYGQMVDHLQMEVEEKMVTVFLPEQEDFTLTYSMDVADNPHNDFSLYSVERTFGSTGEGMPVLSVSDDDGFDAAAAQNKIRQDIQAVLMARARRAAAGEDLSHLGN